MKNVIAFLYADVSDNIVLLFALRFMKGIIALCPKMVILQFCVMLDHVGNVNCVFDFLVNPLANIFVFVLFCFV